jgi:hypothetical protein
MLTTDNSNRNSTKMPGFQKDRDIKASLKRPESSFGQKRAICVVQRKTLKMRKTDRIFRVNQMFFHKFLHIAKEIVVRIVSFYQLAFSSSNIMKWSLCIFLLFLS